MIQVKAVFQVPDMDAAMEWVRDLHSGAEVLKLEVEQYVTFTLRDREGGPNA